jgi:hypothetical protein
MEPPHFTQHVIAHDFLAHRESWKVLEAPAGSAPELGILTPAASQETDSGDKPAMLLPPPSSVELVVPEDAGPCVLRAAAGADKKVRGKMPEGLDAMEVEFELWLDGASVFRERIRSERLRDGVYTPEDWVWRHVGGAAGLAVRPGQTIRLATRIVDAPAGVELPLRLSARRLRGLWLERETDGRARKPRPKNRTSCSGSWTRSAPIACPATATTARPRRTWMRSRAEGRSTNMLIRRRAGRGRRPPRS